MVLERCCYDGGDETYGWCEERKGFVEGGEIAEL